MEEAQAEAIEAGALGVEGGADAEHRPTVRMRKEDQRAPHLEGIPPLTGRKGRVVQVPADAEALTVAIDGAPQRPGKDFVHQPDGTLILLAPRAGARSIAVSWWDWRGGLRQSVWNL